MKYEDDGILRILTADFGYTLRNKESGSCSEQIYLGINDSQDNYEEVINEKVSEKMLEKLETFQQIEDEQDLMLIESATQLAIMQLTM